MAVEIRMPKLTHEMQTGRLVEWFKAEGDEVRRGERLFAVETDKAVVDVEAEDDGVLRGCRFVPDDQVPVGAHMGWIAARDEVMPAPAGGVSSGLAEDVARAEVAEPPGGAEANLLPDQGARTAKAMLSHSQGKPLPTLLKEGAPEEGGRIVASPLARRMAQEQGVDLSQVQGRGPHGRVTEADVRAYLNRHEPAPAVERPFVSLRMTEAAAGPMTDVATRGVADAVKSGVTYEVAGGVMDAGVPYDVVPLSRTRQSAGERLLASIRNAPHFDLELEADMGEVALWREQRERAGARRVSYTAVLVKVVARALRAQPQVNSGWVDGQLRVYREVNVQVAIASRDGLVVPVIRRADDLGLLQIQDALEQLRARAEQLLFSSADLSGGTFTLSDLGMYGVDAFRAIINPPQAAILSVGRIVDRPVGRAGCIELRPTTRMVLSTDHRALDGVQAARFLSELRRLLENPYLLL